MAVTARVGSWITAAKTYFAGAPATLVYVFTMLVTWWTLRGTDPRLTHHLIVSASTNLHNMQEDPLQVLVASAFWADPGPFPWSMILEFLIVMVAAERWLGTWRWLATFAAGHVGATLITVTGIAWALNHDMLPKRIAQTSDVGWSYGFFAVAAAFTFRLKGIWRIVWALGLIGYLVVAAWDGETFTDYGHLCAMAIGFVSYLLTEQVRGYLRRRRAERGPVL